MKRYSVWLLLLILAGCASHSTDNSPEAVCRRQAYDDPAVKRLTIEDMEVSPAAPQVQFDYNAALRTATNACLRQKGVQTRGGVEPVRPQ